MNIPGSVEWETVAVPLVSGIDLNTRARLLEPTKLVVAKNAYFPAAGGPEKRKGHVAVPVEYGVEAGTQPEDYLYGWGLWNPEEPNVFGGGPIAPPGLEEQSVYPSAGPIRGVANRDTEEVVWDGHRLYSRSASGFSEPKTAFFPSLRTNTFGKTQTSQAYSDCVDNGVIRVLAFRNLTSSNTSVKVFDSVTGSLKYQYVAGAADPKYLRVISVGSFVHVFISDITDNVIYHSINHESAGFLSEAQIGVNVDAHFDVAKLENNLLLLAYVDTSLDVFITYLDDDGSTNTTYVPANTQLNIGGEDATRVGIDRHPVTKEIGLIWATAVPKQGCRIYNAYGISTSSVLTFASDANNAKVGVVAAALCDQYGHGIFYGVSDNTLSTNRFVRLRTFFMTASGAGESGGTGITSSFAQRFNVNLVSKLFLVGNTPFVWTCFPSDFQTTYLLMDKRLYPVGKTEYGTAVNNTADPWCFSVNQMLPGDTKAHCALMYKQRVLEQDGVFHEISTKYCSLDFLPEFRRVQAGKALYFPGAQLTTYDGEEVNEANFHFAVEDPTSQNNTTGGALLAATGQYYYRIYQCHKNAQGEEIRGPALTYTAAALVGTENSITLTGKTLPTSRPDSYFLVYRNVNAGTVWYLVSDRDPASSDCPKNNLGVVTWLFVDTISDAVLATRELDPANSAGYLQTFSAPACETVAYGKGRLYVSGGELSPGTILGSRLFGDWEVPSFHINLAYNLDRAAEPITAIGFISDYLLAFKASSGYIVSGDAADNLGQGETYSNQLVLSDVGCVSHNSLVRLSRGILFQSQGGMRMVDASGSVLPVGLAVDSVTDYVVDSILDTENRLVKCYQKDTDTVVFDYESGQWTSWSVRTMSAVANLVAHERDVWIPSDVYTDDGANYSFTVQSAPVGMALGGFQRIRRVGAIGLSDQNYKIRCRTYLDENTAYSEEWSWDSSDDLNESTWGSGTWGSGFWGDSSPDATFVYARDSVWRWRHRLSKQKCSSCSVEITYTGPDKGPIHTALIFEVGRKAGIDRRAH